MVTSDISVGERDLIDSGVVLAYGNETIEIALEPENISTHLSDSSPSNSGLTFMFDFVDKQDEEPDIELSIVSEEKAKITIKNQRSGGVIFGGATPPVGTNTPINVGSLSGRELYLGYLVSSRVGENSEPEVTKLQYNFYLGGDADASE